jgi:hypothetical protein
MRKSIMFWIGVALPVIFLAIAVYYWVTPAGSLAPFVPGYESGSSTVHFKHGLAAAILALLAGVYAWFQSAPQNKTTV